MDDQVNSVDPRILRTRQLLRDAFVELLQEMDVEKLTINRLTERATINRVTFYLHYRDIPNMMDKMADEMIEEINRILQGISSPNQTSIEEKDLSLLRLLEHIADNAKFYKAVLASRRTTFFTERLLNLLTKSIAEKIEKKQGDLGMTIPAVQKDIAIWYGSSALIGVIVSWLRNDMPYSAQFMAKQLSILISLKLNR